MSTFRLLSCLSALVLPVLLFSQSMMVEVPLKERISAANTIVEGKVISQNSFWDEPRQNIFTANQIEVYKVFAGEVTAREIKVITRGGRVDLEAQIVQPSLQLSIGETGIFFLKKEIPPTLTSNQKSGEIFQPFAGAQGFVKYDFMEASAHDPFGKYHDVEKDLYRAIEKEVGQAYFSKLHFDLKEHLPSTSRMPPAITSFTPTTTTAGTGSVITISGSGFGATAGTVDFANAKDGGATFTSALASQIVSWTDAEIQVRVPSEAGTGPIRVTSSGSGSSTSSSSLAIQYAQFNTVFTIGVATAYQTQLVNADGNGGYTFQFFTDFASSDAVTPFLEAHQTWCNASNFYWTVGENTTTDLMANDGTGVVRFDNGGELPAGSLGISAAYLSACFNPLTSSFEWYVSEIDFAFDDGTNWNFSNSAPGGTEFDFQSLALYVIGTAHQMSDVIDPTSAMNFSLSTGESRRALKASSDVAGAADVFSRSTTTPVCSQPLMSTGMNCSALMLLPAELISFSGKIEGKQNIITWETASEINVREHVVERSANGVDGFEIIGREAGVSDSHTYRRYEVIDDSPLPLGFYRLTTYDLDGSMERHKIISLKRDENTTIVQPPSPNPFHDQVAITISSPEGVLVEYQLVNQLGKVVQNGIFETPKGEIVQVIEMDNLPQGIYFLRLSLEGNERVFRVMKK